ncbi:response regulator transcription factor [Rhodalgimonas zhirmunskyi]|uniref:Response regulator transcription factor n=1 Tax=Rhodalgimonas zhirmunskyi TaxID=2964767 RepID=A0AAJ1U9U5_9RHOB|nr:response regulator transcription factor [Rhodoalgimonas zhirmunskyi]MDQ2095956.1 response regulator transcription factor [Rhodoalgimonas zhirmunskyi]
MKLLLVEDDTETAEYIVKSLTADGYVVDHVEDGRKAIATATVHDYDVMVFDRMLPGLDGLSLVRALRAAKIKTPILLLTALGEVEDRVDGLHAGADDYLPKPFAISELSARLSALTRRPPMRPETTELLLRDLRMDLLARSVTRAGETIDLVTREFTLLQYFLERPGRVQTKAMLLENVWNLNFDPQTSVVETHISRLRAKIDKPFGGKPLLRTIRGVGYVIGP